MTTRPRQLRRNASDAENRLWYVLRNRGLNGLKFVRQFPIGPYIADFACREAALIVELDGGQHAGNAADDIRTAFLRAEGYSVLRFWNDQVLTSRDTVCDLILGVIEGSPSPDLRFAPATLPDGERNKRCPSHRFFTSPGTGPIHFSPHWGEVAAQRRVRGRSVRHIKSGVYA